MKIHNITDFEFLQHLFSNENDKFFYQLECLHFLTINLIFSTAAFDIQVEIYQQTIF